MMSRVWPCLNENLALIFLISKQKTNIFSNFEENETGSWNEEFYNNRKYHVLLRLQFQHLWTEIILREKYKLQYCKVQSNILTTVPTRIFVRKNSVMAIKVVFR